MNYDKITQIGDHIRSRSEVLGRMRQEVMKVIVGQERLVDRMLMALITDGHILLEGVPGLAKTTIVKTVAQTLGLRFHRISFTPTFCLRI